VKTESTAPLRPARKEVQIKLSRSSTKLVDSVKEAMAGLLEPENARNVIGPRRTVKKVFELSPRLVAVCRVTACRISRTARARRAARRRPAIYDGGLANAEAFQDDAKEVRSGLGVRYQARRLSTTTRRTTSSSATHSRSSRRNCSNGEGRAANTGLAKSIRCSLSTLVFP
jgi:translation initiation factor IF-2